MNIYNFLHELYMYILHFQYFYVTYLKTDHVVLDSEIESITEGIIIPAEPSLTSMLANATMADEIHMFPSYMSNYAVLILIAIAVIAQLTHLTKIVLMTVITGECVSVFDNLLRF